MSAETHQTVISYFWIKLSHLFKHFIIPFWGSSATFFLGTDKYGFLDDEGGSFDG